MIVKNLSSEDADEFFRLSEAFYGIGVTKRGYNKALSEKTYKQVISKHENLWGYLIVDCETNKNAGYALVTSYWCNEEGGNVLILDELYIDPEFRHRKFGKNFLQWLEIEFADIAVAITLEVLSTNIIAKELYQKDGFYEDGFVTMSKAISKSNF